MKKRFSISFSVETDGWSNESIEHSAIQELDCMSPYPEDIIFKEVFPFDKKFIEVHKDECGQPYLLNVNHIREVTIYSGKCYIGFALHGDGFYVKESYEEVLDMIREACR